MEKCRSVWVRMEGCQASPVRWGCCCLSGSCEPLAFCLHRSVFRSTRSALGSVIADCQGLPRGLLKLLVSLTFFADETSRSSFLDRVTSK